MNERDRGGRGRRGERRRAGAAPAIAACFVAVAAAQAAARPVNAQTAPPAASGAPAGAAGAAGAATAPAASGARPAAAAKRRRGLRESLGGPAREAFDRGVVLFEAKNPSGAYAEFERAYELSKDPRLLFNMALADRDQRRFARAVAALERARAEGAGTLSAEEMSLLGQALGAFLPFTALLTVTCDQAGATVFVDDVPVGTTPLPGPVRVDVGERRVSARKDGFRDASATRSAAGDAPLDVALTLEPRGKLVVEAPGAPGAKVTVDGVEVGRAPWEGEVPTGARVVTVSADGFVSATRNEVVARNAVTNLAVTLRPDRGRLRVRSDSADSAIVIDGRAVGRGAWEGPLRSGPHSLLVKRDGAEPYAAEVTVLRDQTRTMQINLRSRSGGWHWYVGGGALLAGAAATTVFLLTRDAGPATIGVGGTLNPNRTPTGISLPFP